MPFIVKFWVMTNARFLMNAKPNYPIPSAATSIRETLRPNRAPFPRGILLYALLGDVSRRDATALVTAM